MSNPEKHVSVNGDEYITPFFKLNLPSTADFLINGSRVLNLADKGGISSTHIPIIAGTAQTSALKAINVSLDTVQANWLKALGNTIPAGVTTPNATTLQIASPGSYDLTCQLFFTTPVTMALFMFINGVQTDYVSESLTTPMEGGSPVFSTRVRLPIDYGKGDIGNKAITLALQATKISDGTAASYTGFSYLRVEKREWTLF